MTTANTKLFIFLLLLPCFGLFFSADQFYDNMMENNIPIDWYFMPEDSPNIDKVIYKDPHPELPPVAENVALSYQKMLELQRDILKELPAQRRERWHLSAMNTSFALNAQGVLGLLVMQGAASVNAMWGHGPLPQSIDRMLMSPLPVVAGKIRYPEDETPEESDPSSNAVPINTNTTAKELHQEVSPIIKTLVATHILDPRFEENFRHNFLRNAAFFRQLVAIFELLEQTKETKWVLSRFLLSFAVSAQGNLTPQFYNMAGVGAGVQIRFEWNRTRPEQARISEEEQKKQFEQLQTEIAQLKAKNPFFKMLSFVYGICLDLSEIPERVLNPHGKINQQNFHFARVFINIGLSAKGNVVTLIKGQTGAVGSLMFKRMKNEHPPKVKQQFIAIKRFNDLIMSSSYAEDRLPLTTSIPHLQQYEVQEEYNIDHLRFAKKNNIPFIIEDVPVNGAFLPEVAKASSCFFLCSAYADRPLPIKTIKRVRYYIARKVFQEQLIKAAKIAHFFAEKSYKIATNSPWYLSHVTVNFALSITGTIGLVELTHSHSIDFVFRREEK